MDRVTALFVDGMGAAAATSGILSQLQGRIFALLYLRDGPVALEESASELEQSKSNVSVNIRGLVDWHLVPRTRVGASHGSLRGRHRLLARAAGDHGAPLPPERAPGAGRRRRGRACRSR